MKRLILLLISTLLLAACGTDNSLQILETNHALAGTQVGDLRITASVQAARAQTTVDFMQTQPAFAAIQSIALESTLEADGTDTTYIQTQRALILGSSPTPSITPTFAAEETENASLPTFTPISETPTPTIPGVTPISPTETAIPTLPPDPDALRLENLRTALAAGTDGCGANITTQFTVNTQEIYVIATAYNLKRQGATFSARWTFEGQPVGPIYEYVPNKDHEQLCIWFFVDPTDFPFSAGSYSVTIDIDGVPAFSPLPFIISQ